MGTASRRYEVADEEWERIKGYFEKPAGRKLRRPRNDERQMLNGILWIARSGAAYTGVFRNGGIPDCCGRFLRSWQKKRTYKISA